MADNDAPPPASSSLHRSDSQATSISLVRLDPAPIDSPAAEMDKPHLSPEDGDELSEDMENSTTSTVKPGSTVAPGLSGSGHGAIFYLTRLQKYSSFAINAFTTLHLANVSLIPAATGSVDASETYLLMTREIYQTAVTEPLLVILPFAAHVGSGVALRLLRRRQNVKRYGAIPGDRSRFSPWPGISYISAAGYALTVFYGVHVYVNRLLPLAVEGDSSNIGLAYVAHGFARHPLVARVAYVGLIATAAGHMIWGNAKWLGLAPSTRGWLQPRKGITGEEAVLVDRKTRRQRRRRWLAVHGAAVGFAALWAVGGLGVVARAGASGGWVGSLYDDVLARTGLYA